MRDRVFGPAGMHAATIADDPRGVVRNYARGNGLDLFGEAGTLPYGAVGSYAPVGGTLATLDDLGLVVLNSMNPGPTGPLFYTYVVALLLSERFGLNVCVPARVDAAYEQAARDLTALGDQAERVNRREVEPFVGITRVATRYTWTDAIFPSGSVRGFCRCLRCPTVATSCPAAWSSVCEST
jgi:CubicO group peptidase (beta-lactamase class C family)